MAKDGCCSACLLLVEEVQMAGNIWAQRCRGQVSQENVVGGGAPLP
jgi:hypothetical protein